MGAELGLHLSILVDINARADVTKERSITGISRTSGIIDPAICAIVSAKPVLHSEIFTDIKVAGVNLYAALKVVAMHSC
jgi:hypothetical protein